MGSKKEGTEKWEMEESGRECVCVDREVDHLRAKMSSGSVQPERIRMRTVWSDPLH